MAGLETGVTARGDLLQLGPNVGRRPIDVQLLQAESKQFLAAVTGHAAVGLIGFAQTTFQVDNTKAIVGGTQNELSAACEGLPIAGRAVSAGLGHGSLIHPWHRRIAV